MFSLENEIGNCDISNKLGFKNVARGVRSILTGRP